MSSFGRDQESQFDSFLEVSSDVGFWHGRHVVFSFILGPTGSVDELI